MKDGVKDGVKVGNCREVMAIYWQHELNKKELTCKLEKEYNDELGGR